MPLLEPEDSRLEHSVAGIIFIMATLALNQPTPAPYADEPDKTASLTQRVYGEVIELLAHGGGPEAVIEFRSSDAVQDRAYELVYRKREGTLTAIEERELDAYEEREHFVRMAKARARLLLAERNQNSGDPA